MTRALALIAILAAQDGLGKERAPDFNSYKAEAPPEIVSDEDQWLNTEAPLTLEGLKGRVVLLEFANHTCPECVKLSGTLTEWHEKYEKKGLTILSIYDGTSESIDVVRKLVERSKLPYPVLRDSRGNVLTYGIKYGTTVYLVGLDGTVLWEGLANKHVDEIERLLKAELAKLEPDEEPKPKPGMRKKRVK